MSTFFVQYLLVLTGQFFDILYSILVLLPRSIVVRIRYQLFARLVVPASSSSLLVAMIQGMGTIYCNSIVQCAANNSIAIVLLDNSNTPIVLLQQYCYCSGAYYYYILYIANKFNLFHLHLRSRVLRPRRSRWLLVAPLHCFNNF